MLIAHKNASARCVLFAGLVSVLAVACSSGGGGPTPRSDTVGDASVDSSGDSAVADADGALDTPSIQPCDPAQEYPVNNPVLGAVYECCDTSGNPVENSYVEEETWQYCGWALQNQCPAN